MVASSINSNGRGVDSIGHSVVSEPKGEGYILGDYILSMSGVADGMHSWGSMPAARDRQLREFWPTEPILAGAIFTTVARYVAFGWSLDGPERQRNIVDQVLNGAEFGKGWETLMTKVLIDLFTQDNGAFVEIIRTDDDARAPCVSLKHLDTSRCIRTGRAEDPIIYYDFDGIGHRMKYYQVMELTEFPSPLDFARGMQYCAVTRCLRAAQLIRDMLTFMREKMSGRFHRAVHIVGGVQMKTINDAMTLNQFSMDAQGMTRFAVPVIIAALDPTKTVSHEQIDLASLPDGFQFDEHMKWYINQLALAFGSDYQDFAPLPGGNLGSAQQSETLHLKSRGKGPRLFMSMVENRMNYQGIMPKTVKFSFGDQDVAEDMQHARLRQQRTETLESLINAHIIDPIIARRIAGDYGDLHKKYVEELGDKDLTPDPVALGLGVKPGAAPLAKPAAPKPNLP